jgi:hypothetical protein
MLMFSSVSGFCTAQSPGYYGKYIGKLKTLHHSVTGEVFAVDARTLHIRDFTYDGEGPGKSRRTFQSYDCNAILKVASHYELTLSRILISHKVTD